MSSSINPVGNTERNHGDQHIAILSLHTSPFIQPGHGDSGGMNVYIRELVSSLAHKGAKCSVYVRRWKSALPDEELIEPGVRLVHIDAGSPELKKNELVDVVDECLGQAVLCKSAQIDFHVIRVESLGGSVPERDG